MDIGSRRSSCCSPLRGTPRNEMEERVRKRLGAATARCITVRTYHSLGMAIIGDAEGKRPALARSPHLMLATRWRPKSLRCPWCVTEATTIPFLSPLAKAKLGYGFFTDWCLASYMAQ